MTSAMASARRRGPNRNTDCEPRQWTHTLLPWEVAPPVGVPRPRPLRPCEREHTPIEDHAVEAAERRASTAERLAREAEARAAAAEQRAQETAQENQRLRRRLLELEEAQRTKKPSPEGPAESTGGDNRFALIEVD